MRSHPVWRVVRWIPLTLLLLVAGVLSAMLLRGGMLRVGAWFLVQELPPLLGLITLIVVGLYALGRRRLTRASGLTLVVALLSLLPALMIVWPLAYPASLAHTTPIATVRLPADGPLKVAWGGDRKEVNYHVIAPNQRWAYDLVVEPYFTGSETVTDYGCYGVPVLAPIAGEVVVAHDGEPDEVPGAVSNNVMAPLGNHVALQLETGTFLILAHLKPGSLLVKEGERVTEGQPLGACGNSGNTSEPHIHIHHQRQDPRTNAVLFAEGLPLYFRDHEGRPMPEGGYRVVDGTPVPTGDSVQHRGGK